jgi:hypothetical protein
MELTRIKDLLRLQLSKDDARSLRSVITSQPGIATKEQQEKGTFIWSWLVNEIITLDDNYDKEVPEAPPPPPPDRLKRR